MSFHDEYYNTKNILACYPLCNVYDYDLQYSYWQGLNICAQE